MAEGVSVRVHPQLGVLVKLPEWEDWRWLDRNGRPQPGAVTDSFAERPGWTDPVGEVQAQLDLEISRRTLGGTPPPSDQRWANRKLEPPPSASDPNAPPHRREGMDRSGEGWKASARPPLRP